MFHPDLAICSKMHLYRASRWLYRGLVGANSPHYHITAHMAHTAHQGSKEGFGLTNLFSVAHTWYLSIIYFYAFCGKFHTRKCVNWQQNFLATKTQCRVTHWIWNYTQCKTKHLGFVILCIALDKLFPFHILLHMLVWLDLRQFDNLIDILILSDRSD